MNLSLLSPHSLPLFPLFLFPKLYQPPPHPRRWTYTVVYRNYSSCFNSLIYAISRARWTSCGSLTFSPTKVKIRPLQDTFALVSNTCRSCVLKFHFWPPAGSPAASGDDLRVFFDWFPLFNLFQVFKSERGSSTCVRPGRLLCMPSGFRKSVLDADSWWPWQSIDSDSFKVPE